MTISRALFSSRSEEWATPDDFFLQLNAEFHFTLDAAATPANAKCIRWFSKEDDALHSEWCVGPKPWNIFCNPPYGRNIGAWFAKAREAAEKGATVVMLAHARTDTKWWHEHVQGIAREIRFVRGRVKFISESGVRNSAPFPSAVIIYGPTVSS